MIKVGDLVGGKYRVTRILGEGGMGIVVQAHHDMLDMLVAIKFMRSAMIVASGGAERFLREARVLVKLKSQHAVKVHDLGVHLQMPYIVMEHLEGSDMQSMLDQNGPMNAPDAARHIRQACEAIAEAHSLGIYHRDLKPANLFLARGVSGRIVVKVLDFGIAKMILPVDDRSSLKASLTGTTTLMGTLPYMSPEQLLSPRDIDARADIWSLGVVLYELVTGELPFQGQDMYEVQQAIRHRACPMIGVPLTLQPILQRCLEKNPVDRYASAVELAWTLRPIVVESFSPFGDAPVIRERLSAEGIVTPNATASPLPGMHTPLKFERAEGLAGPADGEAPTLRASALPPEPVDARLPVVDDGPNSDDAATLRVDLKFLARGTVVMSKETPEPQTVKQARASRPAAMALQTLPSEAAQTPKKPNLGEWKPHVVLDRRNVLVVKNGIQSNRRRRRVSRASRLLIGAVVICAVAVGINACRKRFMSMTMFHAADQSVRSGL